MKWAAVEQRVKHRANDVLSHAVWSPYFDWSHTPGGRDPQRCRCGAFIDPPPGEDAESLAGALVRCFHCNEALVVAGVSTHVIRALNGGDLEVTEAIGRLELGRLRNRATPPVSGQDWAAQAFLIRQDVEPEIERHRRLVG